ncbi:tubulin polyglutamylase TTLL11-like [Zootoca vivipara]|uniref:tubulin polyglutamylase TTLL11-like n=1 Tax=Zootoca vivipara TaxID=8524 RepID=UPI00293BB05B|nr:tubulin polyglutamylase TTLL11-like [Zootoca vivipara]
MGSDEDALMQSLCCCLARRAEVSEAEWERKNDLLEEGPVEIPELDDSKTSEAKFPSICLRELYPKLAKEFDYLRLVERIAALFIRFLGVKGTTKLGPTGFRMFIRNSKLSNSEFSMASADILYIDITKKQHGLATDRDAIATSGERQLAEISVT